jgi:hypothetical protein
MTVTVRSALFAVLTTLLAQACDRPEELPDMGVSRTALSFEAPGGTGEPVPQTVFVRNTGRGSLAPPTAEITYADGAAWLDAQVTGGAAPYTVTVTATTAGLSPGIYSAAVTLSSANASSSPVQVDVTLTVPDPRFTLSTDHLDLSAPRGGGDPAPGTFQIVNGGRGTLPVPEVAISYVGPTGWLSTAVSGTPESYAVAVSAHVAGLDSGTYTATLSISAPAAEGPPRTFVVTLTVPPAEVAVSSTELKIDSPQFGGDPLPVELSITNPGGGLLALPSVAVEYPEGWSGPYWLDASISGSGAPYTLTLQSRQSAGLDHGSYTARVLLTSPDAANAAPSVDVTFVVPLATITVDGYLGFHNVAGCSLPPPVQTWVGVAGPGTLLRPEATVPPEAAAWLEARVIGVATPYKLALRMKALPPGGSGSVAEVGLASAGAAPATVLVSYEEAAPADPMTASFELASCTSHGQLGAGDPGPVRLGIITPWSCAGTPSASVTYAAGDPAWITTGVAAGWQRQDVLIHGSLAGMAAGERRTASVDVTVPEAGAATKVWVDLTAGDLAAWYPMSSARSGHTVTTFDHRSSIGGAPFLVGVAVVAGGLGADGSGTASVDAVTAGTEWLAPPLPRWRHSHGGTVGFYGRGVILCGGVTSGGLDAGCEWLDPSSDWPPYGWRWSAQGSLAFPRLRPTLVPVGGFEYLAVSADQPAEVTDLLYGTSEIATDVSGSTAVKLLDGRVLVAGGGTGTWIYDPLFREWLPTGAMGEERPLPSLVLLDDGRVLAVGGAAGVVSAEIWDPATGAWAPTAPPPSGHVKDDALKLSNGKVLAVSGWIEGVGYSADVELFDPATESWSVVRSLPSARSGVVPCRLPEGKVFLTGGQIVTSAGSTDEVFSW